MQLNHSVASQLHFGNKVKRQTPREAGLRPWRLMPVPLSSAAPLSTVLSSRFGHRPVVMLGGLLVSAGMVTAAFSQKVHHMYIAIGVVSGEHLPRARTFSGDSVSRMGSGEGGTHSHFSLPFSFLFKVRAVPHLCF